MYFSSNSLFLKSLFFAKSNFSCLLTFILSLFSNSATTSFAFSMSSSLFHVSLSAINIFQCIKYFTTSLIFLLFNIFSTSHFSTLSTSTGFTSFTFCSFTCSLYLTT